MTLNTHPGLAATLSNTAVVGSEALDRDDAGNTSTASAPVLPPTTTIPGSTTTTVPGTTTEPGSTTSAPASTSSTPGSTSTGPNGGVLPVTGAQLAADVVAGFTLLATGIGRFLADRPTTAP